MKRGRWVLAGAVLVAGSCGLASLCRAQFGTMPNSVCQVTIVAPATIMRVPGTAEQRILKALQEPVDFDFTETPLHDVFSFIKDRHALQVFVDTKTLNDAGIDATTLPITSNLKGISLRSALRLMLSTQSLSWLICDEVMIITTQEKADSTFETRTYDVRDLTTNDHDPNGAPDFDSLIKTIVATVKGNWQESGGGATIREFSNNGIRAIAVAQTYDGHEQIEALIAELRKLKPQR